MANRSNTGGKSIWARAVAWFAAYAFVLQTVLAPIAAAAATRATPADFAPLVLCAEHAGAQDQNQPIEPYDHEVTCKFCFACAGAALLTPEVVSAVAVAVAIRAVRWHYALHLGPDRDFLAGKRARGPPSLT